MLLDEAERLGVPPDLQLLVNGCRRISRAALPNPLRPSGDLRRADNFQCCRGRRSAHARLLVPRPPPHTPPHRHATTGADGGIRKRFECKHARAMRPRAQHCMQSATGIAWPLLLVQACLHLLQHDCSHHHQTDCWKYTRTLPRCAHAGKSKRQQVSASLLTLLQGCKERAQNQCKGRCHSLRGLAACLKVASACI